MIEYHVIGKVIEENPAIIVFNNTCYGDTQRKPLVFYFPYQQEEFLKYFNYDNPIIYSEYTKRFKEYKECFVIESEKDFNTGNIIKYNNKDYIVNYKYNAELQHHELYIDYEAESIKSDEDTIKNCKSIYDSCMKNRACRRNEQDKEIETGNNENKILNKLKSIFTRS